MLHSKARDFYSLLALLSLLKNMNLWVPKIDYLLFFTAVASRNSVHSSPKFPISFPFSCTTLRSCLAVSSRMLLGREQVYR